MPYIKERISYKDKSPAYKILMDLGYSLSESQRLIDKGRLIDEFGILKKNSTPKGEVFLIVYKPEPRGLEPVFESEKFLIYDKPSGVLTHPNGRDSSYSLCDEIWAKFGLNAGVTHRLDRETSGLLIVAKESNTQKAFKMKFQKGEIYKEYLAMVRGEWGSVGEIFKVNLKIGLDKGAKTLKNRVYARDDGKFSKTKFEILENFSDKTFIRCIPKTGRQHQLRVHLFHMKHSIIGDTMYGVSDGFAEKFLDGEVGHGKRIEVTGSSRLLLHASRLKFEFDGKIYDINSNFNARDEFIKLSKI